MLVFKPEPYPPDRPSYLLGAKLFYVLIDECARFLFNAAFKESVVALTDHHIQRLWRRMLSCSHTTLYAFGRENLLEKTSYVYMSNHQSFLDMQVLFATVPGSLRMVSKEELKMVPVFGQALDRAGFVFVDRSKRMRAIAQLEKAKDRLREGMALWIAPEGTRARKRPLNLLPFKKGGFHIAIALEVPVVPMWIEGTADVLFSDSAKLYPNKTVSVYFGEPIETKGLSSSDMPMLMEKVRAAMLALQAKAQQLLTNS